MRTTVDLPDDLLKRAKIAAIERGVSLRELIASALAKEVPARPSPPKKGKRVKLPILPSTRPGSMKLTNADIARAEIEGDLRRLGLPR
jgi:hypothetical protein